MSTRNEPGTWSETATATIGGWTMLLPETSSTPLPANLKIPKIQTFMKMKARFLFFAAGTVLLIGLYQIVPTCGEKKPLEMRSISREVKEAVVSTDASVQRANTKHGSGVSGNHADEQFVKITRAVGSVTRALMEDEHARSVLIDEKENAERYAYTFEIKRNSDMDEVVSRLIREVSEREGINQAALRGMLMDSIQSFLIPEGYKQRVYVKVPKDPQGITSFSMMPCREQGDGSDFEIQGKATTVSGHVSPGNKGWRYERLLDLDGVNAN